MKRIIILLLCAGMLAAVQPGSFAEEGIPISAPSAVLMALDGTVLYEKDAHTPREPASVTKVMTLLLVCEAVDSGKISLQDQVTASAHAASMGGSQIWLEEGETMTVEDLLKCVTIVSANDCAVALGEYLSGSEMQFVEEMNRRAAELGMRDTHFVNACGLPAEGHLTSAYDIARMSAELLRAHPWITDYTLIWQDSVRGGASELVNTNKLLKSYAGITGLKTGYTSSAGYCMSATAERDGLHLIAAVMAGKTRDERNRDASTLLDYGFSHYAAVTFTADTPILPIPVTMGEKAEVLCDLSEQQPLVLPKEQLQGVEKRLSLPEGLSAPVLKGDTVGMLEVYSGEALLCRVPVVACEEVPRLTWGKLFRTLLQCITMREELEKS